MISLDNFVKAIDRDGIPWGGKGQYKSIDEALRDMEKGIKALLEEQGPTRDRHPGDARRSDRPRRLGRSRAEPARSSPDPRTEQKARQEGREARRDRRGASPGRHFSITRLTTLKGLCEDPKAAGAFALFLARKIQKRMREKRAPERYRELVNRAVREMKPYLEDPTEERRERLWSLFREIEAEQDEYENIPWGTSGTSRASTSWWSSMP